MDLCWWLKPSRLRETNTGAAKLLKPEHDEPVGDLMNLLFLIVRIYLDRRFWSIYYFWTRLLWKKLLAAWLWDDDVGRSVHFGPDWNVSTAIWRTATKWSTNIHDLWWLVLVQREKFDSDIYANFFIYLTFWMFSHHRWWSCLMPV